MDYIVYQRSDDHIDVEHNDNIIITIKRKFNIFGTLTSTVYVAERIVMVSKYEISLFFRRIKIVVNELDHKITIIKSGKIFRAQVDDWTIEITRHYFKNPLFSLFLDKTQIGNVNGALFEIGKLSNEFQIELYAQENINNIVIILFLIQLAPIMDT